MQDRIRGNHPADVGPLLTAVKPDERDQRNKWIKENNKHHQPF